MKIRQASDPRIFGALVAIVAAVSLARATSWTSPRTSDGQPDLQG